MLQSREFTKNEEEVFGLFGRVRDNSAISFGNRVGIILLHGRAGDETLMWVFSRAIEQLDPVVVAPRALKKDPIGGYSWWNVAQALEQVESPSPRITTLEDLRPGLESLTNMALRLPDLYGVDPNLIFVVGFSQGGALAIASALNTPSLFCGVGLLASFVPTSVQSKFGNSCFSNLNVFMSHGTKDDIVPYEKAEESAAFIRKIGADLFFNKDEVGHKISSAGLKSFKNWFIEKAKIHV